MDSGAKRIEREFTDGDSHTPHTKITETQDSFPISNHYYFRVLRRCITKQRKDLVTIRIGNVKTPWTAKHVTVLPAAVTNRRRVDDRHHFSDMFLQQTVKEYLVAILQR